MLVIAHRGLTERFPDNSPEAIRAAFAAGADWVEVDVRMTADHVAVLAHDPAIAGLPVEEVTYSQLMQLPSRSRPPTLEQGIAAMDGGVNLEIKPPCKEPRRLARLIDELIDPHQQVMVSSFWTLLLEEMRTILDLPFAVLSAEGHDPGGRAAIESAARLDYSAVVLQDLSIDEATRELVGDLDLFAWDVHDLSRVRWLAQHGAAGAIVDDVRGALSVLDRRSSAG